MAEGGLPDLTSRLRVDTTDLERAARRGAAFGSAIGSALGGLASGAIGAGIAKVTGFVTGSVDAFAELEDVTAAAGVTFGKAVGDVTSFAQQATDSAGLSATAATNAALTFGTMGKAAGLGGKDLAGFATETAQLAGDLASFRGTSPEQAIEAVGAALRGETEPIRAYGVLLDDASLRQQAMKMGLISTTKDALTPQQKVLAAHALILKQTGDAQGDFARTADSTANTQKRLAAEAENAQAALGQKLAPAMTAVRLAMITVIDFVTTTLIPGLQAIWDKVGPKVTELAGEFRDLATTLAGIVGPALLSVLGFLDRYQGVLLPIAAGIGAVVAALKIYSAYQAVVAAATRAWMGAQVALNFVLSANPIGLIVLAVVGLVAAFVVAYRSSETFRNIVNGAMHAVQVGVGNAIGFIIDGFHIWLNVWLTVVDAMVSGAAKALGWIPGLGGKLKAANKAFDSWREGLNATLDGLAADARGWGDDVAAGLAEGIRRSTGLAVGAAGDMSNKVAAMARQQLDSNSPSRVFIAIGQDVGKGFVIGLTGTEQDVTSTLDHFLQEVTDAGKKIPDAVEAKLRDAVRAGRGQLVALAQEAEQTRQAFSSIFQATAGVDLTSIGKDDSGAQTSASIIGGLSGQVVQAQQFAQDITTLASRGLSDQAIADLSQRGAAAAGATARALVEGGQQALADVNYLTGQLSAAATTVAQQGSAAFYDAGRASADGLRRGFRSQQDAIEHEMLRIARRMQRAIREALGIHSPSRVFAGIGAEVPAGMAQGILGASSQVDRALRAMVPGLGVPGGSYGVGGAGSSTWAPSVTVQGVFTDPYAAADAAMDRLTWQARLEGATL